MFTQLKCVCTVLLQVTRPDDVPESMGLAVVDEPAAKQSDPTVLDLQLRTLTKQSTVKPVVSYPIATHIHVYVVCTCSQLSCSYNIIYIYLCNMLRQ